MFKKALIIMLAAEGASFLVFNFSVFSLPLLIIAGAATLFFAFRKPEWGIYILFGELFFGSRGHLLEYDFGFLSISLRLVIFAAVFIAWLVKFVILMKIRIQSKLDSSFRWNDIGWKYWLLLLVIGFGIVNGYLRGNGLPNIFNDANGYLYLLILPAVVSAIKTREQIENLIQILAAAILVIAAKTLGLFLWFSFDWPGVAAVYHWIVNQDFGEITGEVGSASRIFMQSQFWALVGLFLFGISPTLQPSPVPGEGGPLLRLGEGLRWLTISAALLSIIMSLSRSFWLGAVAGGVFAIVVVLWGFRPYFRAFFTLGLKLGAITILEVALLYGMVAASGGGVAEAVSSRGVNPSQEAAGSARLLLLPELVDAIKQSPIIGSGFGTTVSYKSYLPDRVTSENPDGEITSFAFEWGYLDIILKVGALGLVMYLLFIAHIFRQGWTNFQFSTRLPVGQVFNFQILGLLAGLAALIILNITTPYLNHPLGIGYLILLYSTFDILNSKNEPIS